MASQPPLVAPEALAQYGVPPAFLGQFQPRAINLLILTGGAFGAMSFQWKYINETQYSADVYFPSPVTTPWTWALDEAFVSLTFTPQSYTQGTVYTIDEGGNVTGGAGIRATTYDLRANACDAVTSEALLLMRNAVTPPLVVWGPSVSSHAAAMAYAWLKRARGSTAQTAGEGDANIYAAEAVARDFFMLIGKQGKPDDMVDSSVTTDGPMFSAYPSGGDDWSGNDNRNWRQAF